MCQFMRRESMRQTSFACAILARLSLSRETEVSLLGYYVTPFSPVSMTFFPLAYYSSPQALIKCIQTGYSEKMCHIAIVFMCVVVGQLPNNVVRAKRRARGVSTKGERKGNSSPSLRARSSRFGLCPRISLLLSFRLLMYLKQDKHKYLLVTLSEWL